MILDSGITCQHSTSTVPHSDSMTDYQCKNTTLGNCVYSVEMGIFDEALLDDTRGSLNANIMMMADYRSDSRSVWEDYPSRSGSGGKNLYFDQIQPHRFEIYETLSQS